MKMRTKLMSALLALVLVVSMLAACGTGNTETKDTAKTGEQASSTSPAATTATAEEGATAEDVYNEWWKLYIQRWNMLVPEVPLYSNQYFDLYNAKFQNFVTTPYWGAADAIIATTVKAGADNSAILGSSTDLSGQFRNSSWGKSSPTILIAIC